jgi:hypothetical protein
MSHWIRIGVPMFRAAVCVLALGVAGFVVMTACSSSTEDSPCTPPLTVPFDGGPNDFLTQPFDAAPVPGEVGSMGSAQTCSRICPARYVLGCTLVSPTEVRCEQPCY